MSHVTYVCAMSYMSESRHTFHVTHTGWRRLIRSPKLQIIVHKRATNYRSLLRKMTYKDKGSYESSPPFIRLKETRNRWGKPQKPPYCNTRGEFWSSLISSARFGWKILFFWRIRTDLWFRTDLRLHSGWHPIPMQIWNHNRNRIMRENSVHLKTTQSLCFTYHKLSTISRTPVEVD